MFKTRGDKMFAAYFKAEADQLAANCLKEVKTLKDWNARKGRYRREMHEMLGLDPAQPRTPLKATVTGKVQHEEFEVWKLHYQSIPKLYVTANLYVPKGLKKPAPAILYVCG
ncbi:MAG TPA: acetylxylan esterase, partial [Verrucomicrobiales bacterium]|nr:acetylxylan esterase [Verrucomicrobiales bacterium]